MPCLLAKHKNKVPVVLVATAKTRPLHIEEREFNYRMKRYGDLWDTIYSMENLRAAHAGARERKTYYREVKMVDKDPEKYLKEIQTMLVLETYKTSDYVVFTRVEGRKLRTIYKLPYFPDRIVHWAIIRVIEPYILNSLTRDTYSALPRLNTKQPKRGTHAALRRVKSAIRHDPENTQYCLKLDMKKYYQSIPHDRLKAAYEHLFKDKKLLTALFEIIDSTPGERGVPIGNYISQYSGNLYLSKLDHWLKEVMRVKYLYRYMDDIVILHSSKEYLHKLFREIEKFVANELDIQIKGNWQVFPTNVRGVDFLGYRVFKDYTLLRKSTALNYKRKMRDISKKVERGSPINYGEWCSYNVYNGGILKYCNSHDLMDKYGEPLKKPMRNYYLNHVKKGGKNHASNRKGKNSHRDSRASSNHRG